MTKAGLKVKGQTSDNSVKQLAECISKYRAWQRAPDGDGGGGGGGDGKRQRAGEEEEEEEEKALSAEARAAAEAMRLKLNDARRAADLKAAQISPRSLTALAAAL